MTILLALAVGLADCHHLHMGNGRNGVYGVFTDDARSQYVAWGIELTGHDNRAREIYR